MHLFEGIAYRIRHHPALEHAEPVWRVVRPWYKRLLHSAARKGLPRTINGTDPLFLAPELHGFANVYEPEVWKAIMNEVRPGDMVADVGAYVGLYTIALAKRVGESGRVIAFEPDPESLRLLERHLALNHVDMRVEVVPRAVAANEGKVAFVAGRGSESHISDAGSAHEARVSSVNLDGFFANLRLDLLKIDVEGFEEAVLEGAHRLLSDDAVAPRVIFIEVHPWLWPQYGVSDETLLTRLRDHSYEVFDVAGNRVDHILEYGEIIARRTRLKSR